MTPERLGDRCGKCPNCRKLEKIQRRVLACVNPPFSHADDGVAKLWNRELEMLPCTDPDSQEGEAKMSKRVMTNFYGYRHKGDLYCPDCPAPDGAKGKKLVAVGSVCRGCGDTYAGRGVWGPPGAVIVVPHHLDPVQALAEKFAGISEKVRKVEINRVPKASLYDLLQYETGAKNPHDSWASLCKSFPEVLGFSENLVSFPGQGQKPTPVVSLKEWLHILMLVKKPIGTEVRQVASDVLESKLNEVMEVVKNQKDEFHLMVSDIVRTLKEQTSRLLAMEDKLRSPAYRSIQLTEKDPMDAIRELFESQWKAEFDRKGLVKSKDDWEKFNSEWKATNCGAKRENWELRHYIAAVAHIKSRYGVDLWDSVLGPFVVKIQSKAPGPSLVRPTVRIANE
jgi:hypothetical protein